MLSSFASLTTILTHRDVFTDDWFADYVDAAYHKNLMIGTDDDHFTPAGTTDRAMLVTILYRMAGSPDVQAELKAMQEEADRKAAEAAENAKNQENTGDTDVNDEQSDANATDTDVNEEQSDPEAKTETGGDAESQDSANADGSAAEDKSVQEAVNTMMLALFETENSEKDTTADAGTDGSGDRENVSDGDTSNAESEDKTGDSKVNEDTTADPEQKAAEEERLSLPQFQDVPDGEYYTDAVHWAYIHHLVDGYNEMSFGPKDPITREQAAVILRNYAKMTGMETTAENRLSQFADYQDIHDWALDALAWANHVGLIQGISDTEIDPGSHATRAQIATLVNRFDEMLPKE